MAYSENVDRGSLWMLFVAVAMMESSNWISSTVYGMRGNEYVMLLRMHVLSTHSFWAGVACDESRFWILGRMAFNNYNYVR